MRITGNSVKHLCSILGPSRECHRELLVIAKKLSENRDLHVKDNLGVRHPSDLVFSSLPGLGGVFNSTRKQSSRASREPPRRVPLGRQTRHFIYWIFSGRKRILREK